MQNTSATITPSIPSHTTQQDFVNQVYQTAGSLFLYASPYRNNTSDTLTSVLLRYVDITSTLIRPSGQQPVANVVAYGKPALVTDFSLVCDQYVVYWLDAVLLPFSDLCGLTREGCATNTSLSSLVNVRFMLGGEGEGEGDHVCVCVGVFCGGCARGGVTVVRCGPKPQKISTLPTHRCCRAMGSVRLRPHQHRHAAGDEGCVWVSSVHCVSTLCVYFCTTTIATKTGDLLHFSTLRSHLSHKHMCAVVVFTCCHFQ